MKYIHSEISTSYVDDLALLRTKGLFIIGPLWSQGLLLHIAWSTKAVITFQNSFQLCTTDSSCVLLYHLNLKSGA